MGSVRAEGTRERILEEIPEGRKTSYAHRLSKIIL